MPIQLHGAIAGAHYCGFQTARYKIGCCKPALVTQHLFYKQKHCRVPYALMIALFSCSFQQGTFGIKKEAVGVHLTRRNVSRHFKNAAEKCGAFFLFSDSQDNQQECTLLGTGAQEQRDSKRGRKNFRFQIHRHVHCGCLR